MRVALGQVDADRDVARCRDLARAAVASAAADGADLLVLPEYASVFDPRGVGPADAEEVDGPYVTALRGAAREHGVAVVAGVTLPGGDGARAGNGVVLVTGDGDVALVYRKVHLYDAFGHRESDRFEPGPLDVPAPVVRVGALSVGLMTCYDLRFPESARRLVDAGADVLVCPAAWAAGPGKTEQWIVLARARAIESTAYVVAVGMAGRGVCGTSLAVAPDGTVLARLGREPEQAAVDLDPGLVGRVRERNPSLANRRLRVVPGAPGGAAGPRP